MELKWAATPYKRFMLIINEDYKPDTLLDSFDSHEEAKAAGIKELPSCHGFQILDRIEGFFVETYYKL